MLSSSDGAFAPARNTVGGFVPNHGCPGQSNNVLAAKSVYTSCPAPIVGGKRRRGRRSRRRRRHTRRHRQGRRTRHRRSRSRTRHRRRHRYRKRGGGGSTAMAKIGLTNQASSLGYSLAARTPPSSALATPPPVTPYNHCVDLTAPPRAHT